MILWVLDSLNGLCDEVLVAARGEHLELLLRVIRGRARLVLDEAWQYQCPLSGVYTGLREAASELVVTAPCDTPFITREAYTLLIEALMEGAEAAAFRWGGGYLEPLIAVYKRSVALEKARSLLERGVRRVSRLLAELDTVYVPAESVEGYDRVFLNVNTPEDLSLAEALLSQSLSGMRGGSR